MANSLLNFVPNFQVEAERRRLSLDKPFINSYASNVNNTAFHHKSYQHNVSESYVIIKLMLYYNND